MSPPDQPLQPPPPKWIWDTRYRKYRYYDYANSCWVFDSGSGVSTQGATPKTGPSGDISNVEGEDKNDVQLEPGNPINSTPSNAQSSGNSISRLTQVVEQTTIPTSTDVEEKNNDSSYMTQEQASAATMWQSTPLPCRQNQPPGFATQPHSTGATGYGASVNAGHSVVQHLPWSQVSPHPQANTESTILPLVGFQPKMSTGQYAHPYDADSNATPRHNHNFQSAPFSNRPFQSSLPDDGRSNDCLDSELIAGTEGIAEELDSRFRVQPVGDEYFVIGQVFRVLWSEPVGEIAASMTISAYQVPARNLAKDPRFGESFYVKLRWPIQTYGKKGVTGDKQKSRHAIIHTDEIAPSPEPEEIPRGRGLPLGDPIRVVSADWEKLDPKSRVNFDQVYTIQHNVKVRHFGKVHKNSEWQLVHQFMNACNSTAPRRYRQKRTSSDFHAQRGSNAESTLSGPGTQSSSMQAYQPSKIQYPANNQRSNLGVPSYDNAHSATAVETTRPAYSRSLVSSISQQSTGATSAMGPHQADQQHYLGNQSPVNTRWQTNNSPQSLGLRGRNVTSAGESGNFMPGTNHEHDSGEETERPPPRQRARRSIQGVDQQEMRMADGEQESGRRQCGSLWRRARGSEYGSESAEQQRRSSHHGYQ